jgi:hypothetical protein
LRVGRVFGDRQVWNLDKADKSGNPLCLRSIKIQPPVGAVVPVTCLAVLEDLSQVAIGLCNGVVLLMRDLGHERAPKLVPLSNPSYSPITGTTPTRTASFLQR